MSESQRGARIIKADRSQLNWDLVDLDAWLEDDHRARIVWAFVETLELGEFYSRIKARGSDPGRPTADPKVLLALWLMATIEGVGSARELDRLTKRDLAYRWLAGGVPLNYHGLSDFRVGHVDVLDRLMTESLTAMMAEGLIALDEVIVDGTKVKAHAGRNSFKDDGDLARLERDIYRRIETLKNELDADPASATRRRNAARERSERERMVRVAKARKRLEEAEAERKIRARKSPKEMREKKPPQASTTDPDARKMRFADGSIAPGYNVQVATTATNGIILAVKATDRRKDAGLAPVMVDEVERHLGRRPKKLIADTGYATASDIVELAGDREHPVTVYAPPPPERANVKPDTLRRRRAKRAGEPDALKEWRVRMMSEDGIQTMRRRKRIELTNAHLKNRGLGRMLIRGLEKVSSVCLLHALAHNLMTAHRLRAIKT